MKLPILFLVFFSLVSFRLASQENGQSHIITPGEEKKMPEYIQHQKFLNRQRIAQPPPTKVRTMAEWEQIQAVIITWTGQAAILKEIVRNAVKECKVLIITMDSTTVTSVLTSSGIPMDSVRFINTPFNTIWVCDYGPWSVYSNDADSLYLIDWIYNRPRPQDDATPVAVANYLHIPLYEATVDPDDFVHTGGNHFSDGMRNAFSSMLVLDENADKTEAEIDSIAYKYLGVNQYVKFPTLPYDGIHHLDMHMRIIDEETIIVGQYPDGVADGPQIEANLQYLNNEVKTSFGHPYRIIRIPMPPDANNRYPDHGGNYRTYTNAVFLNKTLLVPTYEEKYDTTALRIYRESLPGYNVVGINCNSIIPSLGALHCITKLVGVNDPLLIAHSRLRDSDDAESDYPVSAYIRHSSGIAEAYLYYRLSGDSIYTKLEMGLQDTLNNIWTAVIPAQHAGKEVQYYIEAKSNSGKHQVRPIVAPKGYFNFRINGLPINQPPSIEIVYPSDQSVFSIDQSVLNIEMNAADADGSIDHLALFINGDSITTIDTLPYLYDWTFPGVGQYEITAQATDNNGAQTWSAPVNVTIGATTGVTETGKVEFNLFPNPVDDILWIKNDSKSISELSISNFLGQEIFPPRINNGSMTGFDFSGISPGIYLVKGMIGEKMVSMPVVKR